MKWTLRITVALAVLLGAYTAWPLLGLYRIANAVEARNPTAVAERVDFNSLRRSLTEQIVATYLRLTGKAVTLGPLGTNLAIGIGATVADPFVARLLNPEALLDFLNKGQVEGAGLSASGVPPINTAALRSAWQVWLNSEYGAGNVYFSLPPGRRATEQFRVRLRLVQWQWKLAGLDLPEELRVRIAQELIKAQVQ